MKEARIYAAVESVKAVGSQLPLLGDRPNQPKNLSFPSKSYGNRNRSFQSGWFDRHPWLHYVESLDAVFCHISIKAVARNLISSGNADNVFMATITGKVQPRIGQGHGK